MVRRGVSQGEGAAASPAPVHTLDLLPEGHGVVRIYFRNEPVPDCQVTLMTGAGVETSFTSNPDGRITLPASSP